MFFMITCCKPTFICSSAFVQSCAMLNSNLTDRDSCIQANVVNFLSADLQLVITGNRNTSKENNFKLFALVPRFELHMLHVGRGV